MLKHLMQDFEEEKFWKLFNKTALSKTGIFKCILSTTSQAFFARSRGCIFSRVQNFYELDRSRQVYA
jgi:hypothetical protein